MISQGAISNIAVDILKCIKDSIIKSAGIVNDVEKSLITISICVNNELYYSINGEVLNILILTKKDKVKSQLSVPELPELPEHKTYTISYNSGCSRYVLFNLPKNNALISKKVKKNILENVYQFNQSNILYAFNKSVFLNIDANGYIYYYPDTVEIYDIHNIANFIENEHSNINKTYIPSLESILESFNYKLINTNMNSNSYILENLDIDKTIIMSNANIELNKQNSIISTISNMINWFNPFAYYNNSNTTAITTSANTISANTTNNTDVINTVICNKNTSNIIVNVSENQTPSQSVPKYYVSENTKSSNPLDLKIIKLENDKIKILKPVPMLFPVYIENIEGDNFNNIILTGKINETDNHISIKYNKFFVNPIIDILE